LRAAEIIIHSMRGSELILMTAISDKNSRLLSLLKASNHIVCDGPSLSVVENALLKNRSQLMRLPQIICAKNYLSIETINHLKKDEEVDIKNGPWKLSLDIPTYTSFITYATNRNLREKLYKAFVSRASQGEKIN